MNNNTEVHISISDLVIREASLTPLERVILLYLMRSPRIDRTQQDIATDLGSRLTVTKAALSRLRSMSVIAMEQRPGRSCLYTVRHHSAWLLRSKQPA